MPKYRVKSNIKAGGKNYAPGDIIELSDSQAAAMPWAVAPLSDPEPAERVAPLEAEAPAPPAAPAPAGGREAGKHGSKEEKTGAKK